MSLLSLFALAVALAMDAFAVALSSSASLKSVTGGHYLRMSLAFGLFQAFMPIAGWVLGLSFSVVGISVWFPALVIGLVCALLTALGVWLGAHLGCCDMLGGRASAVGALVLIGIGVKILHEHGVF